MAVKYEVSRDDEDAIHHIVMRAECLKRFNRTHVTVSLMKVHANGCPLDLARLEKASDADLAHDVFGIASNINTKTGKLTNDFHPRYALKQ